MEEKESAECLHELDERNRELDCLNRVMALATQPDKSFEEVFQGVVDFIGSCWHHPKVACVRLVLDGMEFKTADFRETLSKHVSSIVVDGHQAGTLEVRYVEGESGDYKDSLLGEESHLIDAIAKQLVQSITLRRIYSKLQESEQRYRVLMNSLPVIVMEADRKGTITFANRFALDVYGYSQEDINRGFSHLRLHTPSERHIAEENLRRIFAGEQLPPRKYLAVRSDGTTLSIMVFRRLVTYRNGDTRFVSITIDITEHERLKRNMQFYIKEIIKAQEEERRRVARELHDDVLQSLLTLSLGIQAISKSDKQLPAGSSERLQELNNRVDTVTERIRRFSQELRPDILDRLGLLAALESLTNELGEAKNISVSTGITGPKRRLLPETELVLFRIAQEALRNVRKHAKATRVQVKVEFTKDEVTLTIIDNGCGFELSQALSDYAGTAKLGLIGMKERARLLGGIFSIVSQLGKGTTVAAQIPVQGVRLL